MYVCVCIFTCICVYMCIYVCISIYLSISVYICIISICVKSMYIGPFFDKGRGYAVVQGGQCRHCWKKVITQITGNTQISPHTVNHVECVYIFLCEPMVHGLNKKHCICDVKREKSEGRGVRSPAFFLTVFADL